MINKYYIVEKVQEKFPELQRISFIIDGKAITDFSEQTLYPFLIYQNTVDSLNRLITLYLPENSNSSLLTPFISAVGVYRKSLQYLMEKQKYVNETFANQTKQVVYNGNVCSIIQLNYINRILLIIEGKGHVHEIPFAFSNMLNWNYPNAQNIKIKIDEFKKIDSISKKDIFTFPLIPTNENFSGVLLFTNVSKFETLLRTIKISEYDIREHLNIIKTSFKDELIDFKTISSASTRLKGVSLVVSRSDSFRAFDNIIKAGNGSLKHIKTIIIDGFDELVLKAVKANTLDSDLAFLKSSYLERLGHGIQDIFLICSNRNIQVQEILSNNGINSLPWLLTLKEKMILDKNQWDKPEITLSRICHDNFEEILDGISNLISKWRELAKSNFCCGKVLLPIRNLYSLREKWMSFFDPNNFLAQLNEYEHILMQLQNEWFSNGLDYGLIDDTVSFIKNIKDNHANNLLESDISALIKNIDRNDKLVVIVTRNKDESDCKYIRTIINQINPDISLLLINKVEFLAYASGDGIPDLIIYLTWDKELFNSSFIDPLSHKQVYLLNNIGYGFIQKYANKIKDRIRDVGKSEYKYKLLNIESNNDNNDSYDEEISVEYKGCKIKTESIEPQETSPELEELIQEILVCHSSSNGNSAHIEDYVMLFFEDGTHVEWPEHKNVFFYDENLESENASIQKDINDLKIGDQIIVARKSKVLRKVIEDTLSVKEIYSRLIVTDHEWRDCILNYLKDNKWDLLFFRKKLNEYGFRVESDYTVSNWIEGDTIKPHNFAKLLGSLCQMGVLDEVRKSEYYNENKRLKSIKTRFIRSSVQKLLLSLKGIKYGKDEFEEELLNNFIDHIDIKRVLGIIKNKNNYAD